MPGELVSISKLAAAVGLSQNWLRTLADDGQIPSTRTAGGHRRFNVEAVQAALTLRSAGRGNSANVQPERTPDWHQSFSLSGLSEHDVWTTLRSDLNLDAATNSGRTFGYAFSEMLNNAIDHSQGTTVGIDAWIDATCLAVRIHDDGVGVFSHIRQARNLPDDFSAVAELTKGKLTTWPERHTGEGIFFTSKAVDVFHLASGRTRWTVDNPRNDQALGQVPIMTGTAVFVQVDPATSRELRDVFAEFTVEGEFTRSRPSVQLLTYGTTFVSRSEARRILEGLDAFTEIEIDFRGVVDVGQGFVDEVFRVWPAHHANSRTIPINMNDAVRFMVERGLPKPNTS